MSVINLPIVITGFSGQNALGTNATKKIQIRKTVDKRDACGTYVLQAETSVSTR